ncbi:MAG TPA: ExbD/TolR family protein [Gammaproteobacteria bacterium]|nr:ExbD/TolR family protein [Gammaproteobacteria bacterium]
MPRSRRRRLMSQINVVPYIDVSLVLLIIFMITAPLLTRGVKVELPHANAKPLSQKDMEQHQPLVLTVDKAGRLYMNVGQHPDKPVSPGRVVAMAMIVLKRSPKTPVLVRGDTGASYGAVVRGMTLLQHAGATNIGLITKNPNKPLVVNKGKP